MARVCLCVFVLAVLSACRPAARLEPAWVQPAFKIGLVAPFEGRYRPVGYDAIYAARLAVRQANDAAQAQSGPGGYRLELIAYDDGGRPEAAVEQARMLALDQAVLGVVGHFRADTTQAAAPVYAQYGLALAAPANLPADGLEPAVGFGPTASDLAATMWAYLQETYPSPTTLFVTPDDVLLASAFEQVVVAHSGAFLPADSAAQADLVLSTADALTAGQSLADLRRLAWTGRFAGGPELALADFSQVAGSAGADVTSSLFVTAAPWPQDVPGAETFVADYAAVSGGTPPGPYAWATYQAMQAVLAALEREVQASSPPSRSGVQAHLRQVREAAGTAPLYIYRYDADDQPVRVK